MGVFARGNTSVLFHSEMKQDKCKLQEEIAAHFDVSIQNQSPSTTLKKWLRPLWTVLHVPLCSLINQYHHILFVCTSGPLLLIYSYFQFLYIFLKRFLGLKFDCFQLLNFIPIKWSGMCWTSVPYAITFQNRIGPLCFGTKLWLSTIFREQCLTRSLAWIAEHI